MKVTAKQYAQTLLELTEGKSEQEVLDVAKKFAQVLQRDGQMKNASKIMEKFSDLYNEAHGIVETEIVSREKLDGKMIGKLNEFIKEKYEAKEVIVKNIVDEKIKGGIVIKVGDDIIDGSVAAQLKKLKNILSK